MVEPIAAVEIPPAFNWNDTGALTEVYNQRLCGGYVYYEKLCAQVCVRVCVHDFVVFSVRACVYVYDYHIAVAYLAIGSRVCMFVCVCAYVRLCVSVCVCVCVYARE